MPTDDDELVHRVEGALRGDFAVGDRVVHRRIGFKDRHGEVISLPASPEFGRVFEVRFDDEQRFTYVHHQRDFQKE